MSTTKKLDMQTFNDWWARTGEWVEEPNQRRGGESGVQLLIPEDAGQPRMYSKRQVNHMFSSLRYPFGHPTALREKKALKALERLGVKVPKLVFYEAIKKGKDWYAILVTEELKDFISLEEWYNQQSSQPADSALINAVLKEVANSFYKMHLGGWQHGCCYAKHVFIKVHPQQAIEAAFLDLEKARRRWPKYRAALHDIKQLGRHRGAMPDTDWQLFLHYYCELNPKLRSKLI